MEWLRLLPKPGFFAQITQTRDTRTILSGRNRGIIARNLPGGRHVIRTMHRAQLTAVPAPGKVAGDLIIPSEVIAQIVGLTVLECYGVVGMAATSLSQGVARLLSRERITQGVGVRRDGDHVEWRLAVDHAGRGRGIGFVRRLRRCLVADHVPLEEAGGLVGRPPAGRLRVFQTTRDRALRAIQARSVAVPGSAAALGLGVVSFGTASRRADPSIGLVGVAFRVAFLCRLGQR
jgi:GNAT superfamily N-acetyltransferase